MDVDELKAYAETEAKAGLELPVSVGVIEQDGHSVLFVVLVTPDDHYGFEIDDEEFGWDAATFIIDRKFEQFRERLWADYVLPELNHGNDD